MIRIIKTNKNTECEIMALLAGRAEAAGTDVEAAVRAVIEDVKRRGDAAVRDYAIKFDGTAPDRTLYGRVDMKVAFEEADEEFAMAMIHASENIKRYHEAQKIPGYEHTDKKGNLLGQIVRGLERVGIYVPGGTAAYPSTVLMNAIPAKMAGVNEIIMATPKANSDLLAAAWIAGVDNVILAGGAQAVAALAYGTETVPKVDKIVGPGNIYVATAKRMLYGVVDIDMVAGPSEILVLADGTANPRFIASDMLSQAEHDVRSAAMLITTDETIANETAAEIERQLALLERAEFARQSIETNGLIIIARGEDEMASLANIIAPEHLEILTDDPISLLPFIRNAGSVFLGPWSPEPLGDYYAGTNHVLPTSGTARFASPLGVYDFVKRMSYTRYTEDSLRAAKDDIIRISEKEGLTAHTAAVKIRFDDM
jgi:histidinol dehydrogenase